MTKHDLPDPPVRPPAKRRIIQDPQRTPDLWLAVWAANDSLTPSDRRRVEVERARRKALNPDNEIGLIVGPEGVTPGQIADVGEMLYALAPTAIHSPGVSSKLHTVLRGAGVPVLLHRELPHEPLTLDVLKRVVRASTRDVLVAPASASPDHMVMEAARYARHRNLRVAMTFPR